MADKDAYYRRVQEAAAAARRQTAETRRKVARLYEQAAEDMASLAGRKNPGGITAEWAHQYSRALKERTYDLWEQVGDVARAGMREAAERQIGVQTSLLSDAARMAGIDLQPTLARVFGSTPDRAVTAVLQGHLYAPGPNGVKPTLSSRIWNNAAIQSGEIEQVIARALAEKQSPMQLAKALQAYVNPDAAIPSNWNSVYKSLPFQYNVDYNAKRLACTAIRHAAWMTEISTAQENPYAEFMHWELSSFHIIYDICDEHADHDEGLGSGNFPLETAPLPHPFCTCLWYVDTEKSLDEIAKELYRWEQGESVPRLDAAFGEWQEINAPAESGYQHYQIVDQASLDQEAQDNSQPYPDEEVLQAIQDTVDRVAKDFPILNECLDTLLIGNTDGVAAASGDGRRILIDRNDFATMDTLRKRLEEALRSGHTRNTDDPMFIISHELGHVIEKQLALQTAGLSSYPEFGGLPSQKLQHNIISNRINMCLSLPVRNDVDYPQLIRMFTEESGLRAEDDLGELVAHSFAIVYNGHGNHPLSSAVVEYFKKEMIKHVR